MPRKKPVPYNTNEETPSVKMEEPVLAYVTRREVVRETEKKKVGFNDLTPTEWALLSKNVITEEDLFNPVWNDLSSPRNEHQKEHGAVFPVKLAERLIKMYSKEGDAVFDPFVGIGSTVVAAHNLKRHAVGFVRTRRAASARS